MVYRPANPPAPPALFLRDGSVLTRLLLGVDGQTRRGKGRGGDRGVCDPAQLPRYYDGDRLFVFSPRGTAPPGIDSGRFASARVDSGGLVVFCVQLNNLG